VANTITNPAADDGGAMRALVLGVNDHPRALATVRSLAGAGIPVIGVKSTAFVGCHSRYLEETHVVDPTEQALLPFLDAMANDGRGVLFAVHDKYLVLASRHADALSRRFALTMPRWEILGRLMDPGRLYDIARQHGVRTPLHFIPRDEADLERIVANLDFAHCGYALKTTPGIASEPADPSNGRATKLAGSDPSIVRRNCLEIRARLGRFPMIAEIVPGQANQCVAVTMLVDQSRMPVLAFCTHRLGSDVSCESVKDAEAIETAARLLHGIEYVGLVTLEFRRDPRNGRLTLIKADPRVIRPTSLSSALRMDTPTALYSLAVSGRVNASAAYEEGVGWLAETTLFETLWANRDARPLGKELLRIWRRRGRIRAFAYFSLRDPLPFLVHAQWRGRVWLWSRIQGVVRRSASALRRRWVRAGALDV
jgi:predicted ATP-grasp superfamily ATP-dependent carboligase